MPFCLHFGIFLCVLILSSSKSKKNRKGSREIYDIITATSWEKPKYETKWENELNLDVDRFWWKLHNRAPFKISTDVSIQNCSQNFNYKCIFEKNWNFTI